MTHTDQLARSISSLTLVEWLELQHKLQSAHGITITAGSSGSPSAAAQLVDVVFRSSGDRKIEAIKLIRNTMDWGLRESKDFVESAPRLLMRGVTRAEAETFRRAAEAIGSAVEIK